MGDRANIGIRTSDGDIIFLYLHWGGSERHQIVANAIAHAMSRDGDESYFTRIFVSRVIEEDWDKSSGVGLSINKIASSGDGYDMPIYDYNTKTIGIYEEDGVLAKNTDVEYSRDVYLAKNLVSGEAYV